LHKFYTFIKVQTPPLTKTRIRIIPSLK